jgi:hypothetical protein
MKEVFIIVILLLHGGKATTILPNAYYSPLFVQGQPTLTGTLVNPSASITSTTSRPINPSVSNAPSSSSSSPLVG